MRVLITGASGLLGGNLLMLLPHDWELVAISNHAHLRTPRPTIYPYQCDLIGEFAQFKKIIAEHKPDVFIHCAALTNVDRCEKEDRALAQMLHVTVTKEIAALCKNQGIRLVHISTDHIFDGQKAGAYLETDTPHPLNYYAATKLAAEDQIKSIAPDHTIIRTNFFGYNTQEKNDLAGWIVQQLQTKKPLTLFTDVTFSPLLVNILIGYIQQIIERKNTSNEIINIAAHDSCTKYDFGMLLAKTFHLDTSLVSAGLSSDKLSVPRPRNMALNVSKAEQYFNQHLPTVKEIITQYKQFWDAGYPQQIKQLLIT